MKIYEILDRDPRTSRLANGGQARITDTSDLKALAELRAELESFVCDGRFGDALQRILDRYLANLGSPRQDSVWVSGFFGSGKSHLLKMLAHLWVNTAFQDGATARSLVPGGLPDEVEAQLRELDTQARRTGRPATAAAGTMLGGSVDHVRHTVLSILLRACGWPAQYPQAMFCFWLREQGLLEIVRDAVERAGRRWLAELNDLYVSPVIARALIEAEPTFAADERAARQVLIEQYRKPSTDISTAQFIDAARRAVSRDGELPLTVLVLDEVQQYISESADRAAILVEVAEAVQTQFDGRILLVGAGQSALAAGTHALMWLRDRFRITVELTDVDVEAVTRKVLLLKRPTAIPAVRRMLEDHAGEVSRHLRGTRMGQRSEDQQTSLDDYPLLPNRRRFWEACFQAVDAAGTHSQLRSQLRILHDSLHDIAERDLGAAIPTSDLFHSLAPSLVNTGVLLNEISTRIQRLYDGSEEGRLRRDLCGLAFLIGKLPRQEGLDLGVRADAGTLADLLVVDLKADSGPFRKRVADTLAALAEDGVLMPVGEEFRLQTTEGAEWDRAFRERRSALAQTEVEIATRRDQLFGQAVQEMLGGLRLVHGRAKLRRTLALHTGSEGPREGGDQVTVWLRDGWSCAQRDVEREARRLGQESPALHVFLPKQSAGDLRERILDAEAARQVLDHRGLPASPEGNEARESMESRRRAAEAGRDEIVREVIRSARLFQGGGSEIFGEGLAEKVASGAEASLARLFPRFDEADHHAWEAAVKRARDGSDQPLKVVGWEGPTEDHPVAKEVLTRVITAARGSDLHKALRSSPYGWPQDAVDAAVLALHRSGHLRATRNGQPVAPGSLDQAGIKAAEFRPERVRLTVSQRIALRGLFERIGVTARSGDEEHRAPVFLEALTALGTRAGGEPPLPPVPHTRRIEDFTRLTGTAQLGAILERQGELEDCIRSWTLLGERVANRRAQWDMAVALHRHAAGLPVAPEVGQQLEAISTQRSLLHDVDPMAPLVSKLCAHLRDELAARRAALGAAVAEAESALAADATWARLDPGERADVLRGIGLEAPPPLDLATTEAVLHALDARPLAAWRDHFDAVPQRVLRALAEAVARLPPEESQRPVTIAIRRGTLRGEAEVRQWLAEHEVKLIEAARKGPVIVS